jgi:hypothetical protein
MNPTPFTNACWVRKDGRYPDDSVKIAETKVAFFPNGGGLQHSMSLADFLQHFRPVLPSETDPRYRLAFFSFDDGPTIHAWTTGARWNGWGCPLIERSVLERFIEQQGEYPMFRLDGDTLHFCDEDNTEAEPETASILQHGGHDYTVFSTGNFGLTWNQYDPEEIDLDDHELVHECLHAISPPGITPTIPIKS